MNRSLLFVLFTIGFFVNGISQEAPEKTRKFELTLGYGVSAYSASSVVAVTGRYTSILPITTEEYILDFTTGGLEAGTSAMYRLNNKLSLGIALSGFLYMDRKQEGGLDFDWVDLNWTAMPRISFSPFEFLRVNADIGISSFLSWRVLPGAKKVDEWGYTQVHGVGVRRRNFSSSIGVDFKVSDRIWIGPYAALEYMQRTMNQIIQHISPILRIIHLKLGDLD
ncbi:MAG: hypothetical protein HRT57_08885 [Crocinitomicaceae bacterium]|nr:hypothetical protein [Crocinitomicaceae bacterium]